MLPSFERQLDPKGSSLNVSAGSIKSAAGLVSTKNFAAGGWVLFTGSPGDYALCTVETAAGADYVGLGAFNGGDVACYFGSGFGAVGNAPFLTYNTGVWYYLGFETSTAPSSNSIASAYWRSRSTGLQSVTNGPTGGTAQTGTSNVVYLGDDADGSGNAAAIVGNWKIYNRALGFAGHMRESLQRAPVFDANCVDYLKANFGLQTSDFKRRGSLWTVNAGTFSSSPLVPPVPETLTPKSYAFLSGGGPAAYTLTGAAGSFTMTGEAANLRAARILAAASGSFAETGHAANFGVSMQSTSGAFAMTGEAATLLAARKLPAAAGAFVMTGEPASFGTTMPSAAGSFVIAGQSASLRVARILPAASGSFAMTGSSTSFGTVLPASAGSFGMTGEAAGLLAARRLTAAAGSFAMTGEPANLIYTPNSPTLIGAAGAFVMTGDVAQLLAARKLVAAPGSFTMSGSSASFGVGMPAAPGSFAMSGGSATLVVARRLPAAPGSFAMQGEAAGFGISMSAAPGALTMTGAAATSRSTRVLAGASGSFLMVGFAARLISSSRPLVLPPTRLRTRAASSVRARVRAVGSIRCDVRAES